MIIPLFSMLMPVSSPVVEPSWLRLETENLLPLCETLSRLTATSNAGRLLGLGGVGFTFSVSAKPVAGGVGTGGGVAALVFNGNLPNGGATTGGAGVGATS